MKPTPQELPVDRCVRCGDRPGTIRPDRGGRVLCDVCAEAGSLAARGAIQVLEELDRAYRLGAGQVAA